MAAQVSQSEGSAEISFPSLDLLLPDPAPLESVKSDDSTASDHDPAIRTPTREDQMLTLHPIFCRTGCGALADKYCWTCQQPLCSPHKNEQHYNAEVKHQIYALQYAMRLIRLCIDEANTPKVPVPGFPFEEWVQHIKNLLVQRQLAFRGGSLFKGQFVQGKLHGRAAQLFDDGSRYEGQRNERGLPHGLGSSFNPGAMRSEGEFRTDNRCGLGAQWNKDGQLIRCGRWANDKLVESCAVPLRLLPEGKFLSAAAQQAKRDHPNDSALMPDGSHYIGELNEQGQPHGQGESFHSDGSPAFSLLVDAADVSKSGRWIDGKVNGRAKWMRSNGDVESGLWRDGKLVRLSCVECGTHATHVCSQCEAYFCQEHCEVAHKLSIHKGHPIKLLSVSGQDGTSFGPDYSARFSTTAVIVVDLASFAHVLRPNSLPMFLRTLLQCAHDARYKSVVKVLFLEDPSAEAPARLKDVVGEFNNLCIESLTLAWEQRPSGAKVLKPLQASNLAFAAKLQPHALGSQQHSRDHLIVFASSRPQLFQSQIDHWMRSDSNSGAPGSKVFFVHGHSKLPYSLAAAEPSTDKLLSAGIALRPALPELAKQLKSLTGAELQTLAANQFRDLSPYMVRTLAANRTLLASIWPEDAAQCAVSAKSPPAPSSASSSHFDDRSWLSAARLQPIVGVACLWEMSIWHKTYEQTIPAEPRADRPAPPCCLWNAGLSCGQTNSQLGQCRYAHHCQACEGQHRLSACPVNRILHVPPPTSGSSLAARLRITNDQLTSFASWYGESCARSLESQLIQFTTPPGITTPLFRLPLEEQMRHGGLLSLPSGVLCPTPMAGADKDGLLPCEAVVWIDWQNIHPPMTQLVPFFDGLTKLALDRPGVSAIRTINVVIDRTKMPAISAELDRLAARFKLSLIDVQAIKAQAADARLSHRLRTEPRPAVFGEREADLVMLVSGDSDFSPDLCRLVLLGHRLILVYNRQAKKPFKRNPLWETAIDFMDLDSMRPYNEEQKERRLERDEARAQEQERGIVLRVSSMQLRGGDLSQRLPGMSGMCMDSEGHALILTDSDNDRLYRFNLSSSSTNNTHDPLSGSLELLAGCGPSKQWHTIVCIDDDAYELPLLPPLHAALKAQLSAASQARGSHDRVTFIRFGDAVSLMNMAPVAVDEMPAFDAPSKPQVSSSNAKLEQLFTQLTEYLGRLDATDGAQHVQLIVCTRPTRFTEFTQSTLATLLASRRQGGTASSTSASSSSSSSSASSMSTRPRASLHCTFISSQGDLPSTAPFRASLTSVGAALILSDTEHWPDERTLAMQLQDNRPQADGGVRTSLTGLAESAQLCRPSEVAVDPTTHTLFICDAGHSRIAVLDRKTGKLATLTPTVAGVARCPRHLFLDPRTRRLWITDLADGTLGFFEVAALELEGNGTASANFTVVRTALHPGVSAPLPLLSRSSAPGSKCLSANGRDLMFCDEQLQAFCQLTQIGAEFSSAVVYRWGSAQSAEASSNAKDAVAPAARLQFDSLLLDSDGSYLFADCSSHCIKRLVQVGPLDSKASVPASSSSEWKISLVAGKGQGGFADGEARESRFKFPATLVADISEPSSLFICERGNRRLRKLHVPHPNTASLSALGARNADGKLTKGSRGSNGSSSWHSKSSGHSSATDPSHYKTRPCRPFQQGECKYQHAHHKCNFIHECSRCGGTHCEKDCEHAAFLRENSCMTARFTGHHGGRVRREPEYFCEVCSHPCSTLALAVAHLSSALHQKGVATRDGTAAAADADDDVSEEDKAEFAQLVKDMSVPGVPAASPVPPSTNDVEVVSSTAPVIADGSLKCNEAVTRIDPSPEGMSSWTVINATTEHSSEMVSAKAGLSVPSADDPPAVCKECDEFVVATMRCDTCEADFCDAHARSAHHMKQDHGHTLYSIQTSGRSSISSQPSVDLAASVATIPSSRSMSRLREQSPSPFGSSFAGSHHMKQDEGHAIPSTFPPIRTGVSSSSFNSSLDLAGSIATTAAPSPASSEDTATVFSLPSSLASSPLTGSFQAKQKARVQSDQSISLSISPIIQSAVDTLNVSSIAIPVPGMLASLSFDSLTSLQGFLGDSQSLSDVQLLYRSGNDGFNLTDFWRACGGKPNTLLVVKVKGNGFVFGAFTPLAWPSKPTKREFVLDKDRRSFLFSLINAHECSVKLCLKAGEEAYALSFSPQSIGFGVQDFVLSASAPDADSGCQSHPTSYEIDSQDADTRCVYDNTLLAGSGAFAIAELECYQLPLSASALDVLPMHFCAVCDKVFNGTMQLQQHLEGKLHKQKAHKMGVSSNPAAHAQAASSLGPTAGLATHSHSAPVSSTTADPFAAFYRMLALEHGRIPGGSNSAALVVSQHASFQRDHPCMMLQRRSNPNKEPSYRCTVCPTDPLVGPIHRALAHTNTAEHKKYASSSGTSGEPSNSAVSGPPSLSSRSQLAFLAADVRVHYETVLTPAQMGRLREIQATTFADAEQEQLATKEVELIQAAAQKQKQQQQHNANRSNSAAMGLPPRASLLGPAAVSVPPSASKSSFPLTTDAQAVTLHANYLREISQSARAALISFNEYDQLQIVKEVDLWNRQTPTGKDGRPINLSARVVHVCKLKSSKQQQQQQSSQSQPTVVSSSAASPLASVPPVSGASHLHAQASAFVPFENRQPNGTPPYATANYPATAQDSRFAQDSHSPMLSQQQFMQQALQPQVQQQVQQQMQQQMQQQLWQQQQQFQQQMQFGQPQQQQQLQQPQYQQYAAPAQPLLQMNPHYFTHPQQQQSQPQHHQLQPPFSTVPLSNFPANPGMFVPQQQGALMATPQGTLPYGYQSPNGLMYAQQQPTLPYFQQQ